MGTRLLPFWIAFPFGLLGLQAGTTFISTDVSGPPAADFEADDLMEIQGTVQLSGTADVTYRAKNKITIKPGFRAYEGVKMRAGIDADLDGYTDNGDRDGDGIPDEYENEFAALNPDNSTDAAIIDPTFNLPWYEVYHLNLRHEGISPGSLSGPAPTVNALLADFGPDFGTFVGTDTGDRNGDGILDFWETQSDSSLDGFYCALFVADPPYDYRVSSAGIWVSPVIPGDGESHFPSWWDLHGATSTTFDIVRFGKPSAPWVGGAYEINEAQLKDEAIPTIPQLTSVDGSNYYFKFIAPNTSSNKWYQPQSWDENLGQWVNIGSLLLGNGANLSWSNILISTSLIDDSLPIFRIRESNTVATIRSEIDFVCAGCTYQMEGSIHPTGDSVTWSIESHDIGGAAPTISSSGELSIPSSASRGSIVIRIKSVTEPSVFQDKTITVWAPPTSTGRIGGKVTVDEILELSKRSVKALKLLNIRQEALRVVENLGLNNNESTVGNAVYHAYGSCRLTREGSSSWAKAVFDEHEDYSENPCADAIMDLHNNKVGRELSEKWEGDCESIVIAALANGELRYRSNPSGSSTCDDYLSEGP